MDGGRTRSVGRGGTRSADTSAKQYGTGKWQLSDLKVGGIGGNCSYHENAGSNKVCKKNAPIGVSGLSPDVLRLQMKRWLVAGIDDENWESGKKQSTHVSMGGRYLSEFAEGLTEAQCDHIANTLPAPESAPAVGLKS